MIQDYIQFLKTSYPQAYQYLLKNEVSIPFYKERIPLSKKSYLEIKKSG